MKYLTSVRSLYILAGEEFDFDLEYMTSCVAGIVRDDGRYKPKMYLVIKCKKVTFEDLERDHQYKRSRLFYLET
jgi:hypothetical protein